jgi:broad specificity phosphatase PhoE
VHAALHRDGARVIRALQYGDKWLCCLMRVILLRHYKTQSNKEGRILGWGDSPPYPNWMKNINFIDAGLRENGVNLDAVYSSDLERSYQTAKVYAASFGIAEVISVPALKEINYGEVQTREKSWVIEHYPQHKKDPDMVYRDGESFRQMQQRSVEFLLSLDAKHPRQTVLIVAHAGVIRGLVSHFLGLELADNLKQKVSFRYIGDFLLEDGYCLRYDELGEASGFVHNAVIELPVTRVCAVS